MKKPDLVIGPVDNPQTVRYHLWKWRGIQVSLHRWHRSDSDRALHDHSAGNVSVLITGPYREVFNHAWEPARSKMRWPFIPYYRKADTPHRVLLTHGKVWTIWIRFKPWREWGFHCPKGWVHWRKYVKNRGNESIVGDGCG